MKYLLIIITAITISSTTSCRTTKKINKIIAPKDTTAIIKSVSNQDSMNMMRNTMKKLQGHHINYKNFNAKIKVDYEDSKGKQPDILAVVRIVKDSAIWVSFSATIFNAEVFRMLIKKDSIILMDIRNKEVTYRSISYLQEITELPFDYNTIQDFIVGNPIFLDTTVVSYKKIDDKVLVSVAGNFFKHLLTLSSDNNLLLHSKLDDVDVNRNRTADITYDFYENKDGFDFSTYREVTVSEKNRLDIRLKYKQYEFNKELSISFKVPKNFKRK